MSAKDDYISLYTLSTLPELLENNSIVALEAAQALAEIDKLRELHPCHGECFGPDDTPDTWASIVASLKQEIQWRDGLIEMLKLKIKTKDFKNASIKANS